MNKIVNVNSKSKYVLEVAFQNGSVRELDVRYLSFYSDILQELAVNPVLFARAEIDPEGLGLNWAGGYRLDAETIYKTGIGMEKPGNNDLNHLIAYQYRLARKKAHMTQIDLSRKTGIYQADISKIERGIGNPSLLTLKRLADGLGMDIYMQIIPKDLTD